MTDVDGELRERLTTVETTLDSQNASLDEIKSTLKELVRYSIQNEDNRKRINKNVDRIDKVEGGLTRLENDFNKKWWVLLALANTAAIIAGLLTQWIL